MCTSVQPHMTSRTIWSGNKSYKLVLRTEAEQAIASGPSGGTAAPIPIPLPPQQGQNESTDSSNSNPNIEFETALFGLLKLSGIKHVDPTQIDYEVEDDDDIENMCAPIPKIAGKLAAMCRTEISLSHSVANELVARDWLVKTMTSLNVRRTDQVKILPYALRLCFIPTRHELEARKMTLSDDYQTLYAASKTRLRRKRTWLEWFFGKEVKEPIPEQL